MFIEGVSQEAGVVVEVIRTVPAVAFNVVDGLFVGGAVALATVFGVAWFKSRQQTGAISHAVS